jgi:hypothetical protein
MSLSWPVSGSNSWVVTRPLPAVLIGQVQLGVPGIGRSVDLRCDALGLIVANGVLGIELADRHPDVGRGSAVEAVVAERLAEPCVVVSARVSNAPR